MEPPAKRLRVGQGPYDDDDDDPMDDELCLTTTEFDARQDPMYQLDKKRAQSANRLKSRFEHIFEKYGKDFEGVGDEVDLRTGEVVVNNGHLESLKDDVDGDLTSDEEEEEEERILQGKPIHSEAALSQTKYQRLDGRCVSPGRWFPQLGASQSEHRLPNLTTFPLSFSRPNPSSFGGTLFDSPLNPAWQTPEIRVPFAQTGSSAYLPWVPQTYGANSGFFSSLSGSLGGREFPSAKDASLKALPAPQLHLGNRSDAEEAPFRGSESRRDVDPGEESGSRSARSGRVKCKQLIPSRLLKGTHRLAKAIKKQPRRRFGKRAIMKPSRQRRRPRRRPDLDKPAAGSRQTPLVTLGIPPEPCIEVDTTGVPRTEQGSATPDLDAYIQQQIASEEANLSSHGLQPVTPTIKGSRRKLGGTGRGPGRWAKGTKKSDYGDNATSGPGLPPGWARAHEQVQSVALAASKTSSSALDESAASKLNMNTKDVMNASKTVTTSGDVEAEALKAGVSPEVDEHHRHSKRKRRQPEFYGHLVPWRKRTWRRRKSEQDKWSLVLKASTADNVTDRAFVRKDPVNSTTSPLSHFKESEAAEISAQLDVDSSASDKELSGIRKPSQNEDTQARQSHLPSPSDSDTPPAESHITKTIAPVAEVFKRNELDPSYVFSDDEDSDDIRTPDHLHSMGSSVTSNELRLQLEDVPEPQPANITRVVDRPQVQEEPRIQDTNERQTPEPIEVSEIPDSDQDPPWLGSPELGTPLRAGGTPERPEPPLPQGPASSTLVIELQIRPSQKASDQALPQNPATKDKVESDTTRVSPSALDDISAPPNSNKDRSSSPHTPRKPASKLTSSRRISRLTSSAKKFAIASLIPDNSDDEDELSVLSSYAPVSASFRKSQDSGATHSKSMRTPLNPRARRHSLIMGPQTWSREGTPVRFPSTDSKVASGGRREAASTGFSSPLARLALDNALQTRVQTQTPRRQRFTSPDEGLVRTPGGTLRRCGEDGFVCGRDFCFTCCK